jgi:hypothetical protein
MEPEGVYKSPPPVPILSRINPIHTLLFNFPNIHLNIILHLRLGISSGLFPSDIPNQNLYVQ